VTEERDATLFEIVGGEAFFRRLVDAFYDGVATDDVLLRLYPHAPDLRGARERLRMFLVQYWGGPTTYSDERGHPRLRLRHLPFHIGREERDRWLEHMSAAIEVATAELPDREIAEAVAQTLSGYFHPAAEQLRNDTGLPISSAPSGTDGHVRNATDPLRR
jgi:hemoglobin